MRRRQAQTINGIGKMRQAMAIKAYLVMIRCAR